MHACKKLPADILRYRRMGILLGRSISTILEGNCIVRQIDGIPSAAQGIKCVESDGVSDGQEQQWLPTSLCLKNMHHLATLALCMLTSKLDPLNIFERDLLYHTYITSFQKYTVSHLYHINSTNEFRGNSFIS